MAVGTGKVLLPAHCRPKIGDNLLNFPEGCEAVINELLETAPEALASQDVAVLNLLCAPSLAGSEDLNIPKCVKRVDELAAFVKTNTERDLHRQPNNREYGHSEPMWRIAWLITNVKRDFGATYSPTALADLQAGIDAPFSDSRECFIHGLLGDDPKRRWGTCANLPVLVVAVARRLGYPVGLAVTRTHVYARWEGRERFNIEASGPTGMTVHSNDYYSSLRGGMTSQEKKSKFYVRKLTPAEEFATFLSTRVACLRDAARYDETLLWLARALQFAPDNPNWAKGADFMLNLALKHRLWRKHPERKIPAPDAPNQPYFHCGDLLSPQELPLVMTIRAHHFESIGNLEDARREHECACRHNFLGGNEQRDFQHFLHKHHLPRQIRPLMPPKGACPPRRVTLPTCKPHEEATLLCRLADECERSGNFVRACNCLHDLYMFDPSDKGVFQRARAIEERPQFQEQLRALIEQSQRDSQPGFFKGNTFASILKGSNSHVVRSN